MKQATGRLETAIEARQDELVTLIANLVRYPSPLRQEAAAQAYVADHLRASGLTTESWDLDETVRSLPEGGDSRVPFAGQPNIAGVRHGAGNGHSLILNGHIDVVSPEPVAAWTHDPWEAEIVGGRMYGRGAFDMKSGIALNLFLARLLCDLDWAHLGVLWFRVRMVGKAAHAMIAPQGVNAIIKTVPIITALQELERRLNERVHPAWRGVEHPSNLNIGVLRGSDWPSTVPGACELHDASVDRVHRAGCRRVGRLAARTPTDDHL